MCASKRSSQKGYFVKTGLFYCLCGRVGNVNYRYAYACPNFFVNQVHCGPPSSPGSIYIQFAVYAIASIGVIGIARGLCLIRDTPNQSMNLSRGLVHLFGGILAVNLVTFLRGLGATVGGDVQTYIANIIG